MIRVYCDRCALELTDADARALKSLPGVRGCTGLVTEEFDLCADCYAGFRAFMAVLHDWDAARTDPGETQVGEA